MRGPTVDHEEIRRWAESCNAVPAEVIPYLFDGEPAVLRFMFGGPVKDQPELRPISWESFFATFDLMKLVFVSDGKGQYQLMQTDEKSRERYEGKSVRAAAN